MELLRFRLDLSRVWTPDPDHLQPATSPSLSGRQGEETLAALVTATQGIEATIATAAISTTFHGPPQGLWDYVDEAEALASEVKVVRLSKASPFDVLLELPLTVSSIAAGAYGLAWGAIRLHNAYQNARVTKARTDAEVALLRHVTQQLPDISAPPMLAVRRPPAIDESSAEEPKKRRRMSGADRLPPRSSSDGSNGESTSIGRAAGALGGAGGRNAPIDYGPYSASAISRVQAIVERAARVLEATETVEVVED